MSDEADRIRRRIQQIELRIEMHRTAIEEIDAARKEAEAAVTEAQAYFDQLDYGFDRVAGWSGAPDAQRPLPMARARVRPRTWAGRVAELCRRAAIRVLE